MSARLHHVVAVALVLSFTLVGCGKKSTTYVASKKGKVFYAAECGEAKKLAEDNLVSFETLAAAQSAGYGPALTCPGKMKASIPYVGNKSSKKLHKYDCANAKQIKPDNRQGFASVDEGKAAGFELAKDCK